MTSQRIGSALAVMALAVLAAACGGSDSGSSGGGIDFADSFPSAAVCNGEPHESVSAAPASGYAYLNSGDGWSTGWNTVFGDDVAIVGDDAENILCATVTESSEAERCEYEEDGESFTLILMDASYSLELRFAKSANVIARDEGTAVAEGCPTVVSWTAGEGERRRYPEPTEALDRMLSPFFG